eukprot:6141491-Amphidinium_carterae.1
MLPNDAGYSSSVVLYQTVDQTTGLLRDTVSKKAKYDNPSLTMSGGAAVTAAWTWPWTSTRGPFLNQWCRVTNVTALAANKSHLESASVATTGDVRSTLLLQHVCLCNTRCAVSTLSWTPDHKKTGHRAPIVIEARATGLRQQPQNRQAWVTGPTTELRFSFRCYFLEHQNYTSSDRLVLHAELGARETGKYSLRPFSDVPLADLQQ